MAMRKTTKGTYSGVVTPLMNYQQQWKSWALRQEESEEKGGILADEKGMGKTIQALSLILAKPRVEGAEKTLIVCHSKALQDWAYQIAEHTKKRTKVFIHHGPKREITSDNFLKSDLMLTTYAVLEADYKDCSTCRICERPIARADIDEHLKIMCGCSGVPNIHSIQWDRVIFDEPFTLDFIRAFHSPRNNCIKKVISSLKSSKRWILTGAPIHHDVGVIKLFIPEAVRDTVPAKIVLRRTKEDTAVELGLPIKKVVSRFDTLDEEEDNNYKAMYKNAQLLIQRYFREGTVTGNYAHIFHLITELQQAVDHRDIVLYPGETCCICTQKHTEDLKVLSTGRGLCVCCLRKLESLNRSITTTISTSRRSSLMENLERGHSETSTKIEALREEISQMLERNGAAKGIVISQFHPFLQIIRFFLQKSGIGCVILLKSCTKEEIDDIVNKFYNDPNCRILLLSSTNGIYHNLTVASNVFVMDASWNPSVENYIQEKVYTIGQFLPVSIVKFVMEETIEERIQQLVQQKGSATWKLSDADIRFLFPDIT